MSFWAAHFHYGWSIWLACTLTCCQVNAGQHKSVSESVQCPSRHKTTNPTKNHYGGSDKSTKKQRAMTEAPLDENPRSPLQEAHFAFEHGQSIIIDYLLLLGQNLCSGRSHALNNDKCFFINKDSIRKMLYPLSMHSSPQLLPQLFLCLTCYKEVCKISRVSSSITVPLASRLVT